MLEPSAKTSAECDAEAAKFAEDLSKNYEPWEYPQWDELDWSRIKELTTRDILEYRKQEAVKAQRVHALECPNFFKHVSSDNCTFEGFPANQAKFAMRHDEWLIKENITQLRQLMSDQNLQLLPDYEQRIAVLKDLGFIDENSRVELKGKVACEVRL